MTKVSKTFSLDDDLIIEINKLENPNEIINQLWRTYFSDKHFQEKSLEEKVKDIIILEDEIAIQKLKDLEKMNSDIQLLQEKQKQLADQQQKEIDDNIKAVEVEPELANDFINAIRLNWSNDIFLDFLAKFREKGLRIGIRNLRIYANYKGIFEPIKD